MQFTREEMATLVDMLLLALWATESSVQDEADARPDLQRYSDLAERIFASARRSGDVRGLEYDANQQMHIPTQDYEDQSFALRCYEAMRDSVFWEELTRRLAERDVAECAAGNGGPANGGPGQDERRTQRLIKEYWDKFAADGIDHLRLLGKYPHG